MYHTKFYCLTQCYFFFNFSSGQEVAFGFACSFLHFTLEQVSCLPTYLPAFLCDICFKCYVLKAESKTFHLTFHLINNCSPVAGKQACFRGKDFQNFQPIGFSLLNTRELNSLKIIHKNILIMKSFV